MSIKSDKKIISEACKKLSLEYTLTESVMNTFYSMKWRVEDKNHLIAFIAYLFLLHRYPSIPLYYISGYIQPTIDALKEFDSIENKVELEELLTEAYNKQWSIRNVPDVHVTILTHFTLGFIPLYRHYVDRNF